METHKTAALIARLVHISKEGRDTFNDAAEKAEDGLRFLFHAISEQHQQFLEDLTPLSASATTTSDHDHDPYPDRHWAPMTGIQRRSAQAVNHELPLVSRCADVENEAVMEYQAAISIPDLSEPARAIMRRHLNSMKAARNYLRGLSVF